MKYAKALLAVAGAVIMLLVSVMSDGVVTNVEWTQVAIAAVSAVGVYVVPNIPEYPYTKTIVAALLVALNLGVSALADGSVSQTEWVNIGLAVLTALGVYKVSNGTSTSEDALDLEGEVA